MHAKLNRFILRQVKDLKEPCRCHRDVSIRYRTTDFGIYLRDEELHFGGFVLFVCFVLFVAIVVTQEPTFLVC